MQYLDILNFFKLHHTNYDYKIIYILNILYNIVVVVLVGYII